MQWKRQSESRAKSARKCGLNDLMEPRPFSQLHSSEGHVIVQATLNERSHAIAIAPENQGAHILCVISGEPESEAECLIQAQSLCGEVDHLYSTSDGSAPVIRRLN